MVLSAGAAAEDLSLDAFIAQAADYEEGGSGLARLTKLSNDVTLTQPTPVRRVRELLDWVRTGEYDRIVGGEYVRRGEERPAREEAADAAAHYSGRFKDLFRDAGGHVNSAGQQLSDWLRTLQDDGKPGKGPDSSSD